MKVLKDECEEISQEIVQRGTEMENEKIQKVGESIQDFSPTTNIEAQKEKYRENIKGH